MMVGESWEGRQNSGSLGQKCGNGGQREQFYNQDLWGIMLLAGKPVKSSHVRWALSCTLAYLLLCILVIGQPQKMKGVSCYLGRLVLLSIVPLHISITSLPSNLANYRTREIQSLCLASTLTRRCHHVLPDFPLHGYVVQTSKLSAHYI